MAYQAALDEVHEKAVTAFRSFKTLPLDYRLAQLRRLRRALEALKEDMNAALLTDLGRSHMAARLSETEMVVDMCSHAIDHLSTWMKPEPRESTALFITASSEVSPQPYGTALIISSWNFPFDLTFGPLIDAIAAGNTVVIKPSELSPACSDVIEKAISALDKDCYQTVQGGPEAITYLLTKRWDVICFTGSGAKGKLVAQAAAEYMTPTILELGGKNPAIVDETADIANAALRITQARFLNAGQLCLSPEYVLIHKSIEQSFSTALTQTISDFYGPDPKQSPDLGRMISESATKRAAALLEGHGGETLVGGQTSIDEKYVAPTVIRNPSLSAALMQEENFAPILTLLTYTDFAECVEFINNRPRPLGVYYFGSSAEHFSTLKHKTFAGALLQNECAFHFSVHDLPFGGVGDSGHGRTHGRCGFNAFSNPKAVFRNDTLNIYPISNRYPPYTPKSEQTFFRVKAILGCLVAILRCRPMRWVRSHWLSLIVAALWLLEPKYHLAASLFKRISS
jgi:aldehyde dehydrogenase (NAD+)